MQKVSIYLSCFFLLYTNLSLAIGNSTHQQNSDVRVTFTKDINGELHLVSKKAPLTKILTKISEQTGVGIHYSTLSKTPVTVSCSGVTVKLLLECLFGSNSGLVVQYVEKTSSQNKSQEIDQVWLLDTAVALNSFESEKNQYDDSFLVNKGQQETQETVSHNGPLNEKQINELLILAKAENPKQRAITKLVNHGPNENASIAHAFEQALADEDVTVRAVAIHGLVHIKGTDANAAIEQALLDDNVTVRLMALSSAANNSKLLLQALTDSDETVRQMAEAKLAASN